MFQNFEKLLQIK